jgi:carboxylesterase type B
MLESVIFCLRSLSIETLLNFADAFITQTSAVNDGDVFFPVVDQNFLLSLPSSLLSSVKFPKMPLIIGREENDATLFTPPAISTPTDTQALIALCYPYLTSSTLSTLLGLYPSSDFEANIAASRSAEFYRSAELLRDIIRMGAIASPFLKVLK